MIPRSRNHPRTVRLALKVRDTVTSLLLASLVMGSASLLEAQGVGTIAGRVVNDVTRQPLVESAARRLESADRGTPL